MSIYKRGNIYWYKFMSKGELVRESTKQGNDRKARIAESQHRARLAQQQKDEEAARNRLGCAAVLTCHECEKFFNADKAVSKEDNVFCTARCATTWRKTRTMPTLKEFLDDRFVPDAETRHKQKPMTVRYYRQGADMLKRSKLAELGLDELTDEHAQQFAGEFSRLSASGINRGLRTLRRALNLAFKWNQLEKPVKVELAKGEKQRERVLTNKELAAYLDACPQPWRDVATIISEEGMRPGEVFALRWSHVLVGDDLNGLIRIVDGKSKAARRILPMTPSVHGVLKTRHETQKRPADGWIFPAGSGDEHITGDNVKDQHGRALKDSKVSPFVPYVLRHTALTRLASSTNGDLFALARIAGHSTITITQRYVHPQADTIERIFSRAIQSQGRLEEEREEIAQKREVGTKLGTAPNAAETPLLIAPR